MKRGPLAHDRSATLQGHDVGEYFEFCCALPRWPSARSVRPPPPRRPPAGRSRRRSRRRTRTWRRTRTRNIHNDTWMTDAYQRAGPLGNNLATRLGPLPPSLCGSIDVRLARAASSRSARRRSRRRRRGSSTRTRSRSWRTYDLPTAPNPPGTKEYQNFTGGGYFFLDNKDRIWRATKTDHLFVLARARDGTSLRKVADYDLDRRADAHNERITSALPDFHGPHLVRLQAERQGRHARPEDRHGQGDCTLDEEIENSFAVDRDGVYIVSDKRMYRFSARPRTASRTSSGRALPQLRDRQAEPGRRRLGHDADDHARRLRRDHRQRRSDERRRLPHRRRTCDGPEAHGLRGAGLREGRERDRELADRRRPLAGRREQLRLPGPVRPQRRRRHRAGLRPRRHRQDGSGCTTVWTNTTERARRRSCRSSRPRPA